MLREEGLSEVISMHSLVVALGITNIWQPLIAYILLCMMSTVTVVCAVCGLGRLPKEH